MIIRAYSDDTDDQVLSEIRPRYIVMYEPNQDFIRRIEVRSPEFTPLNLSYNLCASRYIGIQILGSVFEFISCFIP